MLVQPHQPHVKTPNTDTERPTLDVVRDPEILLAVRKRASVLVLRQLKLCTMILRIERYDSAARCCCCCVLRGGRRVLQDLPGDLCGAEGDKVEDEEDRTEEDADDGDDDATVPQETGDAEGEGDLFPCASLGGGQEVVLGRGRGRPGAKHDQQTQGTKSEKGEKLNMDDIRAAI